MLKPRYLEQLPESMIALYSLVEQDILSDMARRIATYDYWIPAANWQYQKLIEMGNFHSYVQKALSSRTGKTEQELARLMKEAGAETLSFDTEIYKAHGLDPPPLAESVALQGILREGLKKTKGTFQNLTGTTASTSTKQFENALDRAWLQVSSGAFDANTAVRTAVKDLSRQGLGAIAYPTGHVDNLEVAVRRAVVTGVNQTALRLQEVLANEMGCDLVETTAHAGARPEHAVWQGQIFSRSGRSREYPDFVDSTGYGSGAGLGGWNCRHSFFPYYEGNARAYSGEMLREYEAESVSYNGRKMTEYEASQTQRYHERQIRRWKRENLAMQSAGLDTSESAAKIRQWQETQKDFVRQTGLKRQGDREQIANWGRKQAGLAMTKVRKVKDPTLKNSAGQSIITVKHTTTTAIPNSVTQKTGAKGGVDRNYYGANGKQTIQISNNGHGHKKEEALGLHGEHAHDYIWGENGTMTRGAARELTEQERRHNLDFL